MTVTSYKWTSVMSCNKFRELFLYSVLMLFDDLTIQGEHNRKNTWEITARCMDTKTVLHCDFLGTMGYPFPPSCTLSNLNWNKITGVKSALHSLESHSIMARWWFGLTPLSGKKIVISWRKAEKKKSNAFLSILWDCWKQLNTVFKWVW